MTATKKVKREIVTNELLIAFGFEKEPLSMSIDISLFKGEYKRLVVDGFDMMAIRQGRVNEPRGNDDLVVIHNSDVNGLLSVEKLKSAYRLLTEKELVKTIKS